MEPILRQPGSAEGYEILYFENCLIEKLKGDVISFSSMGTLSVLYFRHYDRFVLQLNDWRYPLLRRLPVVADRLADHTRDYILPAGNGFSYRLSLGYVEGFKAITNFEKILMTNSNFYFRGENSPFRKSEVSPDDKLSRHPIKHTGLKESITQTLKMGLSKVKVAKETITTGTRHLNSRKKRTPLSDIKYKSFRRRAHCTFQKNFFEVGHKITSQFIQERVENVNLIQERDLKDLKVGYHLPRMYVDKEELEDLILDNKEIAAKGNFHLSGFGGNERRGRVEPRREQGFGDILKEGFREVKHTFSEMLRTPDVTDAAFNESLREEGSIRRHRDMPNDLTQGTNFTGFENISHYQG